MKLRKSVRPNRQYPGVPAKSEVDLDFRGHPNRMGCETTKNGFLEIENVRNEEITKIHKTQSTVP